MNSSSRQTTSSMENGSKQQQQRVKLQSNQSQATYLSIFDLIKIGLSSTLAIAVFINVGYVVRQTAGPSTILSVVIAALIAFLAGTFYVELNRKIVGSVLWKKRSLTVSDANANQPANGDAVQQNQQQNVVNQSISIEWLMPSYAFANICNGEFAAFIIAWNLIMEYIVAVAIVSKVIVFILSALIVHNDTSLTEFVPHFDLIGFVVPILIGVPMVMILGRNSLINIVSIALMLLIVVIFLIVGLINADISNWYRTVENNNAVGEIANENYGTGGFYAYGVDGMFRGVAIILFIYIAFDGMIMSNVQRTMFLSWLPSSSLSIPRATSTMKISNFNDTISYAVLSINGILFLCSLGIAIVLTTIQPYYSLHKFIPLLTVIDTILPNSTTIKSIILIMGFLALLGSLYALLHAIMRTIETMVSSDADDSTFKLFGKFRIGNVKYELREQRIDQQLHQHRPEHESADCRRRQRYRNNCTTFGCLLSSLLSGLLAGLFGVEQLINLLSIGTLLMLYTLSVDIIILRYSVRLKAILYQTETNGKAATTTRSISLIAILLSIYCVVIVILVAFIRLIQTNTIELQMHWSITILTILSACALLIVYLMGMQLSRNALFDIRLSRNPLFPSAVILMCIYLCTVIEPVAWIRFAVWILIGVVLYAIVWKCTPKQRKPVSNGIINNGFLSDQEQGIDTNRFPSGSNEPSEVQSGESSSNYRKSSVTMPTEDTSEIIEMQSIQSTTDTKTAVPIEALNSVHFHTEKRKRSSDSAKFDEIASAEEIRDVCVERREPNGTIYFVEVDQVKSHDNLSIGDKKPLVNGYFAEQAEHERALYQNDANLLQRNESQLDIPLSISIPDVDYNTDEGEQAEEEENEIKAIVHASNEFEHEIEQDTSLKISVEEVMDVNVDKHQESETNISPEINEAEVIEEILMIAVKKASERKLETTSNDKEEKAIENDLNKSQENVFVGNSLIVNGNENENETENKTEKETGTTVTNVSPVPITKDDLVITSENDDEKSDTNGNSNKITVEVSALSDIRKPFVNQQFIFNDSGKAAFKERLERLLSQPGEAQSLRISQSSPTSNRQLPLSLVNSAPESMTIVEAPPTPLNSPAVDISNNANDNNSIPPPPIFNQLLYDTIGRHTKYRRQAKSVIEVNQNDDKAGAGRLQTRLSLHATNESPSEMNLKRSDEIENLSTLVDSQESVVDNSSLPSMKSIRHRLEELFKQPSLPQPNGIIQIDENNNLDGEKRVSVQRKKPIEPFDTVRKQKLIFSNVLKSIEADIFTNLHHTNSKASADIENLRRDSRQYDSSSLNPVNDDNDEDANNDGIMNAPTTITTATTENNQ